MNEELVKKAKDFVKNYNERKYIVPTSPFGLDLASAVHSFEITDENDRYFASRVYELNRIIDQVIASEYFEDNLTKQKLTECDEENRNLKEKVDQLQTRLQQEHDDMIHWKTKAELYEKYYPPPKTEEGDVTDG